MRNRIIVAVLALMLAPASAGAGSPIAEVLCGPRAQIETRLSRDLRAELTAYGLRDAEAVMEVWADGDGRWTLVQRYADGTSCILAMGADWVDAGRRPEG